MCWIFKWLEWSFDFKEYSVRKERWPRRWCQVVTETELTEILRDGLEDCVDCKRYSPWSILPLWIVWVWESWIVKWLWEKCMVMDLLDKSSLTESKFMWNWGMNKTSLRRRLFCRIISPVYWTRIVVLLGKWTIVLEMECSEENEVNVWQICHVAPMSTTQECEEGDLLNEDAEKQRPTWQSSGVEDANLG